MLARKEALDILRERTIVLAMMVQLFVAAFSAFLAVGLLVLYNPGAVGTTPNMDVAYTGPGGFDARLDQAPNLDLVRMDPQEAQAAFDAGRVSAIASESYRDEQGTRTVTLVLPQDEIQTSLLVTELKEALESYERELRIDRADRIAQEIVYAPNAAQPNVSFAFAYSVLIPLLVATPVFLAGAITADSLSDEINEGTLLLLRSSPLSAGEIVVGKLITPVLLVPVQVALWLGLLWMNGIPTANVGIVLSAATAMGALLAAFGILVATVAQREGPTQAGYTVVVLALALLSLLLPQDPANLIARASVGMLDQASYATLGVYGGLAIVTLVLVVRLVTRRLQADRLQPGVA